MKIILNIARVSVHRRRRPRPQQEGRAVHAEGQGQSLCLRQEAGLGGTSHRGTTQTPQAAIIGGRGVEVSLLETVDTFRVNCGSWIP